MNVPKTITRQSIAKATDVTRYFKAFIGKPCWGTHYMRVLNLSMNFGKPHLCIREPRKSRAKSEAVRRSFADRNVTVRGDWWLWIYMARWELSLRDDPSATISSSIRKIEAARIKLDGQKLEQVECDPSTGETSFSFDLGAKLRVWELDRKRTAEIWTLYMPRERSLSVWNDGTYEVGPTSR